MLLSQSQLPALVNKARGNGELTLPKYDRDTVEIGIVHLGPGAFHRAHQVAYTEDVLNQLGGDWAVCGVSMRSATARNVLKEQDNLYTLAILDEEVRYQVIGAIKEVLVAGEELDKVLTRMAAPTTKLVTLTVTEKGYCLDADGKLDTSHPDIVNDLAHPAQPISAIGLIVQALALRFDHNTPPFNVISCDNLPSNGHKLRAAVIALASAQSQSLAAWIEESVSFPCTMVDSITPKTEDYIVEEVSNVLGVKDEWPIQREDFTQWVIEDTLQGDRPAWEKAGVIFSNDIDGFEHAKLRILNGTHSSLAYLGLLAELSTVKEAISEPLLLAFIQALIKEEITPSLTPPAELDIHAYAASIIKRYQNPQIKHLLSQIAWDGSKKLPVRIFDTMADNLSAGRSVNKLAFCIAAWIHFLALSKKNGQDVIDPRAEELLAAAASFNGNEKEDVAKVLDLPDLVPTKLRANPAFSDAIESAYSALGQHALNPLQALHIDSCGT